MANLSVCRGNPADGAVSQVEDFPNTPRDAEERKLLRTLFDPSFYLDRNRDILESGMEPFLHFMEHGAFEGRSPHPLFDTPFYLANHPEVKRSGLNPLLHFLRIGGHAASNPHPLFDSVYYLARYNDIADAGVIPLIHFIEHGAAERRDPHPSFNTAEYLAAHPDVATSGVNPLSHYIGSGAAEGRTPYHPITDPQIESLRRDLAISRMQVAQLKGEVKSIFESVAWRWISRLFPFSTRWSAPHAPLDTPPERSPGSWAARLQGRLLVCPNPLYMGRVYYCLDGKRHWIFPTLPEIPGQPNQDHLECYGLSQRSIVTVDDAEMQRYELASMLPLPWPGEVWADPVRLKPYDLREIATSKLRGSGIEFGAGTAPMAVPLCCDVKYADMFSGEDLKTRAYPAQGKDFVRLSYVMGMEDMSAVPDGSLDFVIAGHVIEHLRNPLRAFEQVYRKLKPGGQYVLVVPEMRRMSDRDRPVTTLEHLVADYEDPGAERDVPHYFEFFSKVYSILGEELAQRVRDAISGNHDLHFHTWTYESFGEMVKYTRRNFAPWHSVWSQPAIWEDPGSHEFYFVLAK
jgi:SAM-dependent methyltransferase